MSNAAKPTPWRAWLLLAVAGWAGVAPAAALAFAPGFEMRGPKNRVGDFFPPPADSRRANELQVADPHQGKVSCGYETASGVHVYLYAHADPVNGYDPSGQNTISLPAINMTFGVIGILQKLVVVSLVTTLVELPFRSWTIWEGVETTSLHAYFVAKNRDGRTYRYDVSMSGRQAVLAMQNPFKHYTATMTESRIPFSEAMTGLRAPVGRLSEITYRFWDAQIPRGPIDYVYAYKNCFTYSTLFAAKAALLTLLPF